MILPGNSLRIWIALFVVVLTVSPAMAEDVVLSGIQTGHLGGMEGRLICQGVRLAQGGTILFAQSDGDGFWIEGPGGIRKFSQDRQALNVVLPKGTYKAFPNLKPSQTRATVTLEIRLSGSGGGATPGAASSAGSSTGTSPFDGLWAHTKRRHTDCGFTGESDIEIKTDEKGITWAKSADFPGTAKGTVKGRTYTFEYGFVAGKATGSGVLNLNPDGLAMTGSFRDTDNHTGTITGSRGQAGLVTARQSSPFEGLWPKVKRIHKDCGYSAESDIQISTDAQGVTWVTSDDTGFPGKGRGKISGNVLAFDYGITNGKPSGNASFTLSPDGKSFSGSFADQNNHHGTVSGKR